MATKTNKQLLEEATKKLGKDKVQEAITNAGLGGAAIKALQQPDVVNQPENQVITPQVETLAPIAPTPQIAQEGVINEPTPTPSPATPTPTTNINITPKAETPKVEAPVVEPQKVEVPTGLPQSIADWKTQGSNISDLERMIETQNNTTVTNENGVLKGMIDGVEYQWNIDQAGNPIKTKVGGENTRDIYNQLLAGVELPDTGIKQTKEYAKAKASYDIVSKYLNMSEDQLYNAYVGGQIGSMLEKELVNNPNLAGAKLRYDKKLTTDNINQDSYTMLNAFNRKDGITTETKGNTFLQDLSDKITESLNNQGKDVLSFTDYMSTNYPDLVNDTKELNQKITDLKRLSDIRDGTLDSIIKSNPGITINKANLLAARQNKDINEQIKSMSYEIGNLQANVNYQTNMADKGYETELSNQARADRLAAESRGYGFDILKTAQAQQFNQQQTQEARQYEQEMIADQRAYEQENAGIKTQMITDPATGQQALINSTTGETIKTYDTGLKGAEGTWTKFDDNTLYNQTTGTFRDIKTGVTKDIQGNVDYSATDFSTNPAYNTLEASFKNNNPTGITWGVSNDLKKLWDDAGVSYEIGTARQTAEGGNYVKFENVQDGLDAYMIALTQRGDDVEARLKKWVGTGNMQEYADSIMTGAGIEKGAKFSELSDEQLQNLMAVQLQRESPKFYNALVLQADIQAPSGGNAENFAYAETLTASDRTKFLKDRGLEDEYISYKAKQSTAGADFSDIQDITDVTFPEKTTMFKTQSFGFGNRMDTATDVIARMEDKYKNSWTSTEYLAPKGEWVPNFLKSSDRQQYEQAQRNFVNAVLRQESGAAIADSEFDSAAKQYFPAAGDSVATLNQKRANREQVIENMYRSSGKDEKGRNIIDIYKNLKGITQEVTPNSNIDDLVSKYENIGQSGNLDLQILSENDLFNKYYSTGTTEF